MLTKSDIESKLTLAKRMREECVTRENYEFFTGKIHAFEEVLELKTGEMKRRTGSDRSSNFGRKTRYR